MKKISERNEEVCNYLIVWERRLSVHDFITTCTKCIQRIVQITLNMEKQLCYFQTYGELYVIEYEIKIKIEIVSE